MDAVTLIEQAKNLHLTLSVTNGDLSITGPKTMAAAALVQRMAPFKTDIIAALAPVVTEPAQLNPLDLVGQTVTAQRFYELQQETAAMNWVLHGRRKGEVVDGYCNEWLIVKAVTA